MARPHSKRTHAEDEDDSEESADEDKEKRQKRVRKSEPGSSATTARTTTSATPAKAIPRTKKCTIEFTDFHRATLQMFMTRGVVLDKDLDEILKKLNEGKPLKVSKDDLANELNAKLEFDDLGMKIVRRQMVEDAQPERMWALVGTKSDEVSKKLTALEPWELAMFNKCLQWFAKAPDGFVGQTYMINNKDVIVKTGAEILKLMQKLCALGWVKEGKKNYFTAGPRTMMELGQVLRTYGAMECPKTKQVVLKTNNYRKFLANNGFASFLKAAEANSPDGAEEDYPTSDSEQDD